MDQLSVFWGEYCVGHLLPHSKGRVRFQYSDTWLAEVNRPISLSLPCQKDRFSPGVSTAFFENLIPESQVRTVLAFNHRFDKKDTFAFLEHFGEDCAGALCILPQGRKPDFTPWVYKKINADLIRVLDRLRRNPEERMLYLEMQPARLSIAGAQDKLPVYFKDDKFYLPANSGAATTHIIKPASHGFPDIQRNEAFCMALARRIGLRVPESRLLRLGSHELYWVERYDRKILPERVARIHQEDFCQALGVPAGRKYQVQGGPGFKTCRELIDEHLSHQGTEARTEMAAVLAFNYMIGNHDAHAKNFSVIHGEELRLAPFYDLLSTQVYPHLERHFAMSIGRTYRYDRVGAHAFKVFAGDMKFRPGKLAEIMDTVIQPTDALYPSVLSEHEDIYGHARIYPALKKVLAKNITRLKAIRDALEKNGGRS